MTEFRYVLKRPLKWTCGIFDHGVNTSKLIKTLILTSLKFIKYFITHVHIYYDFYNSLVFDIFKFPTILFTP